MLNHAKVESNAIIPVMRRLVIALIILIGILFIITRIAEIEDILVTLQQGNWGYLALAAFVEGVWIVNVGAVFKAIYRTLGVKEKLGRLILLATAAIFVNIVAPSGGIGGMAVFISEARSKKYTAGRATVASTLFVLFDYIGFLFILALGFVVLIRRDQVTKPEIIASVIIVIIAFVIASMLIIGERSEEKLIEILSGLARFINRIVKPFRSRRYDENLLEKRAVNYAHEIAEGVKEMRRNPKDLVFPILLAINGKVLMILLLFLVFMAFSVPASVGTLIAGFCVAFLFMIVSPTPSGIGVVEGFLTLALTSFYIPLGTATVLTIAYRGFTFWLPLLVGMFTFRWVGNNDQQEVEA